MELDLSIEKPDWDPNPQKSTTNNFNWRKCLVVKFPNCSFKWIPTYKQLAEILLKLSEVEQENRKLAADNSKYAKPKVQSSAS